MRTICLYFQVHQPFRLRRYRFFDIGNDHYYYDDYSNESILNKVAGKCYLPANELMLDLINKHKEETFLVPLSDIHKEEIPKTLKDQKIKYTKAIIYRTVCSDLADLPVAEYDMLVFFSPSGIKSLKQNFPKFQQDSIKIASFGTTTAGAVEQAGLRLDVKAPMPEAPSMTMALDQFIKSHNKNSRK